jgi:putative flippase GtrA
MTIALWYSLYAAIAVGTNIAVQYMVLSMYQGRYALYVAMAIGTVVGLVVKYALDKRSLFRYQTKGVGENMRTFILYATIGGVLTLVFWAVELGFDALFPYQQAKYVGAVIGLTLGYLAKYQLDKRFVFIKP